MLLYGGDKSVMSSSKAWRWLGGIPKPEKKEARRAAELEREKMKWDPMDLLVLVSTDRISGCISTYSF